MNIKNWLRKEELIENNTNVYFSYHTDNQIYKTKLIIL